MGNKIFILTDSCAWESEKKNPTGRSEHIVEVVDVETGQVRYIKSGAKISLVEGDISEPLNQEDYNKQDEEISK